MADNPSLAAHPGLDEWVEVTADGRIVIHTGKVDIGQRISTALAIVAAEELDVAYDRIDVKRTETGVDPNEGFTAGSMSMPHSGHAVRLAAATARRHLLGLAADALGVDVSALEVEDGEVLSRSSNRSVSYWDLLGGKSFGIPVDQSVTVKAPAEHRKIGRRVVAKGMAEIVTGGMVYVHDIRLPGMLHARLVRPPHYLATLDRLPDDLAGRLAEAGVTLVRDGSFLAVAAADEYAAIKAAERVSAAAQWDRKSGLANADIYQALTGNQRVALPVDKGGAPMKRPVPPLADPPADAAVTLSARFEKPYHMHGSIGPSAACALYQDGKLTVWSHCQGVYPLRGSLAEALGMAVDAIRVVHTPGAGCYGHNGADDAALDAALVARAIPGTPVLLKWTRDDEHGWEPYGTAMVCELRASLDADGAVIDWSHEAYGDTFVNRPMPDRGGAAARLLSTHYLADALPWPVPQPAMGAHVGIHRNLDPLYDFPQRRLVKNLVRDLPLRVSTLRTLGAFGNVVAIESFMTELAEAAGIPPAEFRLRHLDDERGRAVIEALDAAMTEDAAGAADGMGQGIGFAMYKNGAAYAAVGVELGVTDAAEVRLHRVWIAADAGEVVDPDGLTAQMEGGFVQAASWTLHEQVTFDGGGITSRDWESYPILRFDNVPTFRTLLMERPGAPFLGAGEAVSGPAGAAIANAIHDATGLRLRRLPFNPDAIRAAAMQGG